MGLFDRLRTRNEATPKTEIKAQLAPAVMDAPFGTYWGNGNYGGYNGYANSVLRQDAMAVPSVSRCRNLICSTIATIPLSMYSLKDGKELPNYLWVDQPDKRQPRSVTISWLADSLFFYGVAYLMVEEVYQDDLRPARFSWVQNDRVTAKYNQWNTEVEYYSVNGSRVPMSGVGSLVTFQALDQGLLIRSGNTIRAALDVERAAAISAQTPMATGYIRNNGADLPDAQIQGLLNTWKSARQGKSTAYLSNQLEYVPVQFSPKEMTWNESKQYYATEIARACNVPAYMIDAETMRSMTYQNILDGRKEFMAYSLAPIITAIEDRFSMDDLTPRGQVVRFDVDETFLRADPLARLQVTEKLLELGLIDVNQAKEMEDLSPEGSGEYDPSDL
jgi:HK97 family phage portal protein